MGRQAKSGRPPLDQDKVAFLKPLHVECSQVRTDSKYNKMNCKYLSLKHWVSSRVIPLFNSKFPTADAEEFGVSSFADCVPTLH